MLQLKANHAAAFSEDCANLLAEFSSHRSPEFRHFCDAWKHLNFPYIFYGHRTDELLVQFIEDALNIVKQMFVKSQLQLDRIGSIYLLYSLYFKQPTKQFCKLRFTMSEATELLDFYESLDHSYDQVRLIFWKLVQADAFRFVECEHEYGFETFLDRRGMKEVAANNRTARIGTNITRELVALKADLIPALKLLENSYNGMKRHLDRSSGQTLLPPTTVMSNIEKGINNIQEHFKTRGELNKKKQKLRAQRKELKDSLGDNESSDDTASDDQLDLMTIGDRRAMLKNKGRDGEVPNIRAGPSGWKEERSDHSVQLKTVDASTSIQESDQGLQKNPDENGLRKIRSRREFLCLKMDDHFADTKIADQQEDVDGKDLEKEEYTLAEIMNYSDDATSEENKKRGQTNTLGIFIG